MNTEKTTHKIKSIKERENIMNKTQVRNSFLLLLTATIWGVAFVAQSVGMDYVGPFTFNMLRNIIGGIVLIPCIFLLDKINPREETNRSEEEKKKEKKLLVKGGVCCGVLLALAMGFQQIGIQYTTVGRAGFITACYIIIVPLIGMTFFNKKCRSTIWGAVVLALIGLYSLCITEEFDIGQGDFLVLGCSFLFSMHILVIDHFSPLVDGVKMSCIQFFVAGIVSGIPAFLTETIVLKNIFYAWMPVLYAGVLSCGVAYTLQIIGQKNMNPTVASLILSLESCIAVIAGWLILGESLTKRELLGCILMFIAIVLAQLPEKKAKNKSA